MKRILFVFLALALLLSPADARATSDPAYYSATIFDKPLIQGEWTYLNASAFDIIQNGVVTLNGDVFQPTYTGLIEVSGTCMLKREPGEWLMTLWAGGVYYRLIETDRMSASFTVTVPSSNITIWTVQHNPQAANSIRCTLLFRAA